MVMQADNRKIEKRNRLRALWAFALRKVGERHAVAEKGYEHGREAETLRGSWQRRGRGHKV